jgi:23S rRNA pseudouridine1911/1915/1917 synthase
MNTSSSTQLTVVLKDRCAPRLDKALSQSVPEGDGLSRSRVQKLLEKGAVVHATTGVAGTAKTKVVAGEIWIVTLDAPDDVDVVAQDIPLHIIYEDDDLIVVNKATGMVVHPAPGSPSGTLVNALLYHCGDTLSGIGGEKRPGIVHRIDKDTSGLLVVAKSDVAHQRLSAQFADHSIVRHYTAFCHGLPDRGDPRLASVAGVSFEDGGIIRIKAAIARHRHDRQKMAVVPSEAGRYAVTRFKVDAGFGTTAARLDCWLETGRTHQIRVHGAFASHPLIGDKTYGGRRKIGKTKLQQSDIDWISAFPRQALHARMLGFIHPVSGANLEFSSDLPPDLKQLNEILTSA